MKSKTVELDLLSHQHEFITSEEPNPAIVGGLGSGKTQAGTDRLIALMIDDPKVNTLYAMPTYDLLVLRAVSGVIESLELMGLRYSYNVSRMTISINGLGKMIFRSYDNPKKIVAFEVGHAVVDEIDTLEKEKAAEVWRKISERVRQTTPRMKELNKPNSIACVTTPDQGISGFVYAKWAKNPAAGYVLIKASTYDNPFLPDGYTDQILNNYDAILADLYLRGEFVSLNQNKVYWAFSRDKCHSSEIITKNDPIIYYGQDFNVGGNVTIIFKIIGRSVHAVGEVVTMTTQEIPIKLKAKYGDKKYIAYPDASGGNESANAPKSSINLLQDAGHRIDAPNANPAIRDRINAVNGLLSHNRLFINTLQCPMLTDALEAQGYDKNGKPEKYDEHPAIDDYNDALGYFIHRRYPIQRPTIITNNRR